MHPYRLSEEEYERILAFKRDLHMHPELSVEEHRTTERIRTFLETLPDFRILPLHTETGTGLVAQIRGEEKADRADRDKADRDKSDGKMTECQSGCHARLRT